MPERKFFMKKIPLGPRIPHFTGMVVQNVLETHRGWVVANVHHSIPWPTMDVLITYDGEDFILSGIRELNGLSLPPCIKVKLPKYPHCEEDIHTVLKKIYQFTSILGWFSHGYVDVVGYIHGSHPIAYSAMNSLYGSYTTSHFNCDQMPIITDENTRKALAFWREGLKLLNVHHGYSFLSFYKVIESQFDQNAGKVRGNWINSAIYQLSGNANDRIKKLLELGISELGMYIFESGRCAISHAAMNSIIIDPDIPTDRIRIAEDLVIIQSLAEKYIEEILGVPTETVKFSSNL